LGLDRSRFDWLTANGRFVGLHRGFTMIELLLVLVLIALLASVVTPMVTASVGRAREATLKENLLVLRKAIDDYYADAGRYPQDLESLVKKRYLRRVPSDPLTERDDTWLLVRADEGTGSGGITDVHSGSEAKAEDGTPYRDW
jgi:general secretion pathway protein G